MKQELKKPRYKISKKLFDNEIAVDQLQNKMVTS
jgi:hypothetical protein